RHAHAIVSEATHLTDPDARAWYEQRAIEFATSATVAQTAAACRSIAESLTAIPIAERHANAAAERAVVVRDLPDGLAQLIFTGSAVLLHGVFDRLTSMAKTIRREHDPTVALDEGRPADARTLAQLRADLATDLLLTGTPDAHADGAASPLGAI